MINFVSMTKGQGPGPRYLSSRNTEDDHYVKKKLCIIKNKEDLLALYKATGL